MRKIISITILLIIATTAGYLMYNRYFPTKVNNDVEQEVPQENIPPKDDTSDQTPQEQEPIIETITYDEIPAKPNANYFEKVIKVKTEQVYIAYPLVIEKDNPPRLIVYSHGSNTTVTKDFSDPFMKDMQMYGEYFTKRGYAFSASSLHGANWGSDLSVQDIFDQTSYISSKYLIKDKINLLGFSMGGLPVFNYSFKYPKSINAVALLAPTSRTYSQLQFQAIKRLPVQIWHGDKDVNVPYSLSTSLSSRSTAFGFTNIKLETIDGVGHFDIDTELRKEILNFYNKYE